MIKPHQPTELKAEKNVCGGSQCPITWAPCTSSASCHQIADSKFHCEPRPKQPGDNSIPKHWCELIAASKNRIKGGLDFECPHQATQHLHRQHRGTPAQWSGKTLFGRAAGLWLQGLVWGSRVAPEPTVQHQTLGKQMG